MKVLFKVISIIIDRRLEESIELHGVLHTFRVWRGTGTAKLEDKILQEITGMCKKVLYKIFVYIHKYNDTLERGRALEILEGYGVVPQVCRLLTRYWDW